MFKINILEKGGQGNWCVCRSGEGYCLQKIAQKDRFGDATLSVSTCSCFPDGHITRSSKNNRLAVGTHP